MKKIVFAVVILILIALTVGCLFILPSTASKYKKTVSHQVTLNITEPHYFVRFNANGGTGTMADQEFVYGTAQNLTANSFVRSGYAFTHWNTEPDGTGTSYQDKQSVNNLTETNNKVIDLYAQYIKAVAKIGNTTYETLQEAIDAVPTDNTQTTVELLTSVSENLTINAGKNIKFVLHDYTLSVNKDPVMEIFGTVEIDDGRIVTSGSNTAAINVNVGAILNISGGQFINTAENGKQALYNLGGTVNISGGYFENACIASVAGTNKRGAVHNKAGTMVITGGTIVAKNYIGLQNEADLIIGVQDGNPDPSTPTIQGAEYGLTNNVKTNVQHAPSSQTQSCYFYNGTIKGKTAAIDNEGLITGKEPGSVIAHNGESINGETYITAYLATDVKTVTFNPNGGQVTETSRIVEANHAIGTLPVPSNGANIFLGWFTEQNGGTEITQDTVITSDMTVYAHWKEKTVCMIGDTEYSSIKAALQRVPNNTQTTITLIEDVSIKVADKITVNNNKNVIIDMNEHTMSFGGGAQTPLIENNGTLEIRGGTITSNSPQGIINNKNGTLTVNGTTIAATGTRQAVYAEKGTVNITGGSVLSATSVERATVQCLGPATVNIIDATITSENYDAVVNVGTLNIGTADGAINTATPTITGKLNGVNSTRTFNFYDGTLKGITAASKAIPNNIEANAEVVAGTEDIGGQTYQTAHLEIIANP